METNIVYPKRASSTRASERGSEAGNPVCQLSIKTRNRVGKRVEGCGLKRIERIHHPCFAGTTSDIPPLPLLSSLSSFHRSTLGTPYLCTLLPRSRAPSSPPSRSSLLSDRVPLFRVLYYFFYQSARFQDALRPAESCVINHEM